MNCSSYAAALMVLDSAITTSTNQCFYMYCLLQVVTESIGAKVKHYRLVAERSWECDLEQMTSLVDSRTRAIVINNPSNPCGSVYSKVRLHAVTCMLLLPTHQSAYAVSWCLQH
jgi:histidinol-phosphate/aromatic aminotransferase/cobyric acid decarboxylase-like protein